MKRNLRLTVAVFVVASLTCCRESEQVPADSATAAPASVNPDTTTNVPPWENEWCYFDTVMQTLGPEELVAEYLRRDARGEFLDGGFAWYVLCPGRWPGWDAATLIGGFQAGSVSYAQDTARIPVVYRVLADLRQDAIGVHPRVERIQETFVVVLTPFGWRIGSPIINQHLLSEAAKGLPRYGEAQVRRVDSLVSADSGGS